MLESVLLVQGWHERRLSKAVITASDTVSSLSFRRLELGVVRHRSYYALLKLLTKIGQLGGNARIRTLLGQRCVGSLPLTLDRVEVQKFEDGGKQQESGRWSRWCVAHHAYPIRDDAFSARSMRSEASARSEFRCALLPHNQERWLDCVVPR